MSGVTTDGVLGVLSKGRLSQLAHELNLSLPPEAQKAQQVKDIAVVRHRQYLVEDVLPAPLSGQQSRVKLVCLDNAAGRQVEVFWERELFI